jgi:signal transduction histidine kinase
MALYALLAVEVGNFNEQQQDLLHSAYRDTEKLDTLIQDLLILAEIASGAQSLTLESYRPVVLVRDAILRNQCLAETKQITLQTVIPDNIANVAANAEAVKRIFHNLLTNALHYTDYGGQIVITAEEHRSYVAFSVTDNGKGIAPEYLPNLFSRFVYQPNANSDGTGLGLAIVKKLVEAQGGQVSVKSRLQEGTTVTFSLPVAAPPQILENQQ